MEGSVLRHTGAAMRDVSEADLVALAQGGDVDAIGALYDQHYHAIYRYLRARVDDPQLAEDLTSDVFRRMLTGLPRYRPRGLPFRAWLFRIAHNLLIDHYRRESSHPSLELQETNDPDEEGDDPASVVEQKLTMEQAGRALAELDSPQRDVLALRFLSGLSLHEVALVLNRTEGSIKALQRRGLAALRLTLAQE
jgi:RNA polymerase sigma-70 factor, ECF subfamily